MENEIIFTNKNFNIENIKKTNAYIVHLDGQQLLTKQDLLKMIKQEFRLPDSSNWDSLSDWITDLSWIEQDSYILYITNYSMLLKEDQINKQIFLEILEDTVKWFDGEIEKYVVNGKRKEFNVYLIE